MFIGEIISVYVNEGSLENGKPNALKVKPTIMMGSGYFDINDRVGHYFKHIVPEVQMIPNNKYYIKIQF